MNGNFRVALLTAMLTVVLGIGARADDRKEIGALYSRVAKALRSDELEDLISLLSHDFVYRDRKGQTYDREQYRQKLKRNEDEDRKSADKWTTKDSTLVIRKLSITGNSSKATADLRSTRQLVKKGKTHVRLVRGVMTNDLTKTPDGWRLASIHYSDFKFTLDGKPEPIMKVPQKK